MPMPVTSSLASLLAAYSELLSQHIDATARWRLGWPAQLYGTGMAFRTELLMALVPSLHTKVEDVELTLAALRQAQDTACALTAPVFVPHAVVFDPKPASTGYVVTQRARWLQGQIAIWRTLLRDSWALILRGNVGAKALVFSLLLKPKTLVFAVKVLLCSMLAGLALTRNNNVALVSLVVLAAAVLIDVLYYLVGLMWVDHPRLYARALLAAPLYPVMWMWGIVTATRSGNVWLRARD